jgi:thymidylate synthase ThyX
VKVRFVTNTQGTPLTEFEGKSIDEIIVGIARVSSSREVNELFTEPHKLLRHCLSHGHWSIFDEANITIEIATSNYYDTTGRNKNLVRDILKLFHMNL